MLSPTCLLYHSPACLPARAPPPLPPPRRYQRLHSEPKMVALVPQQESRDQYDKQVGMCLYGRCVF